MSFESTFNHFICFPMGNLNVFPLFVALFPGNVVVWKRDDVDTVCATGWNCRHILHIRMAISELSASYFPYNGPNNRLGSPLWDVYRKAISQGKWKTSFLVLFSSDVSLLFGWIFSVYWNVFWKNVTHLYIFDSLLWYTAME